MSTHEWMSFGDIERGIKRMEVRGRAKGSRKVAKSLLF